MSQQKKQKRIFYQKYFFYYTIAFLMLYTAMYLIFKGNGKSFLWDCDGTNQHYPALYYMGDYLKNLVKGLFGMTAASVGVMDFRLGQGMDVLTTLNYYGFGDPLNLLALFVAQDHMEGLYTFLIFLRLYLAGAAFSYYCFKIKRREMEAILLGAILYTFSGMMLFAGVRHPFFINACIYLPLLLVAAERMLNKKKYGCFAGMVFLSLISNFYFAYMNTAMTGIYLLFRIFGMQKGTIREKILTIVKMCGAYLWGVMLSAVVFIPVVYAFLQNARTTTVAGYTDSLLHYNAEYYANFITNYVSPKLWVGSWSILSLASISLLAVTLFFRIRPEEEEKKTFFAVKGIYVVLLLFALIPLFGKLLNGNGYVCNRWMYAFAMVNAVVVVIMAPRLVALSKSNRMFLYIVSAVYIVASFVLTKGSSPFEWTGAACMLVTMAVIAFLNKKEALKTRYRYLALHGLTIATIIVFMIVIYTPPFGRYVNSFWQSGGAYAYQENSPVQAMSEIDDTDFYRVEQPWLMSNQAAVLGYRGNTFYWSIVPASTTKYYDGLALSALDRTFECNGQDARAVLNELSSTKYYVTESTKTGTVPYGYEFVKRVERKDGTVDEVYQNKYALSIGYPYTSYITQTEYEKLAPLYRQEALMSCAVIADADVTDTIRNSAKEVKANDLVSHTHAVEAKIGTLDGITMDGTNFEVTKKDATMEITFDGMENSETYLIMKNFKAVKGAEYNKLTVTSSGNAETTMFLYNRVNQAYYDKEYQGVNIGYSKEKKNSLTITFPSKGTFSYESLEVYCYSFEEYDTQAQAFVDGGMTDVKVSGNTVSGSITAKDSEWVQFSIPYSKGWKAYVDGEEVTLAASNTAYMGLAVSEGTHEIELRYETPYVKVGAAVSAIAAITMAGVALIGRRRRKNHE